MPHPKPQRKPLPGTLPGKPAASKPSIAPRPVPQRKNNR